MGVPVGVKFILDDTNANIPANWSEDTSYAGRYALGATTDADGGTNAGSATHTHAGVTHTHTVIGGAASGTVQVALTTGKSKASTTHTHKSTTSNASGAYTSGTASNDPPYYEVIFITPSSTPQDIPAGVVGLFDDTLPSGWSNYTALNNKWLKGVASGGDAGGTGGSLDSHSHTQNHTHSAKNSGGVNGTSQGGGTEYPISTSIHLHSVTLNSGGADSNTSDGLPPYRDLIPATSASDETPVGVIGLWDSTEASIPANWTRVTSQDDKFLRADSSVATGGADQHSHTASASHNHPASAGFGNSTALVTRYPQAVPASSPAHTHNWVIGSTSSALSNNTSKSNYPLYRTTIFVKYTGASITPLRTLMGVGI